MIQRLFIFLLPFLAMANVQARDGAPTPIPPALIVNGEVVDKEYGFAFKINPSEETWTVGKETSSGTVQYTGINKTRKIVYFVSADPRRYAEATQKNAETYRTGLNSGLKASGWTIAQSTIEPSEIPRKNSFRIVNNGTFANGAKAVFVAHMTSPDSLYAVAALYPEGVDEGNFQALLGTFRLVEKPKGDAGAGFETISVLLLIAYTGVYFAFYGIAAIAARITGRNISKRWIGSLALVLCAIVVGSYFKDVLIDPKMLVGMSPFEKGFSEGEVMGRAMGPAFMVLIVVAIRGMLARRKKAV